MSDPMQNLNEAADALNQVAERAGPFWDDADARLATFEAEYVALGENLVGLVSSELAKTVYVDNTLAEAVGTTFPTIKEAVESMPAGCYGVVRLYVGQTHELDATVLVMNRTLIFSSQGNLAAGKPIIKPLAYLSGGLNAIYGFSGLNYNILLSNCEVHFPTVEADPNVGWATYHRCLFLHGRAGNRTVSLSSVAVQGGVASTTLGLTTGHESTYASVGLFVVSLDGPIAAIIDAQGGVTNIRRTSATLLNGAVLSVGTTLGTNFLQN